MIQLEKDVLTFRFGDEKKKKKYYPTQTKYFVNLKKMFDAVKNVFFFLLLLNQHDDSIKSELKENNNWKIFGNKVKKAKRK